VNRAARTSKEGNGVVGAAGTAIETLAARRMPESLAAEAAVLGSMIIDPVCIGTVVEQLQSEAFYRVEHQYIFSALVSLYESRGGTIDAVLLRDELERRNQLEEVGGVEYLARVVDSVPSSANVAYYAGIVKDKQLLREMIEATYEILTEAFDPAGETKDKLDRAEQRVFMVTERKISGSASALKDLVAQAYDAIERREGKHVTGLATGYDVLNELTCGLQNGEMIIIAGRPSMGKTSLALNMAEHIGLDDGTALAFFSLEMSKQQLAERFLCSRTRIKSQLVRKGILGTEHHQQLVAACGEFSQAPIYIDDTTGLTPLELRAKARRLRSRHGIRCIFVDYLQLMSSGRRRVESRQQEITEISRYLKGLARELNIPVVVLSQLNRSPEGREGHRPRMSDLRESGSIEQDADVVMLLHREDYYHRGEDGYEDDNTAEVIIAKQRNGPTGVVKLAFMEEVTRFENAPASYVKEPF